MNKYTVSVLLRHTFYSREEYIAEVEAENEDEAVDMARQEAYEECDADNYDAEHEESDIFKTEITKTENLEAPRCDKTKDLFEVE